MQQDNDMNPLPPILLAQQPMHQRQDQHDIRNPMLLQNLPGSFRNERARVMRNGSRIQCQLQILYEYLRQHDPKMLARVLRVHHSCVCGQCRGGPKCLFPDKETMRQVRKTMGELHWRMYLEYYKYSCWSGSSNPHDIPIDLDCTIVLPPPFPTLSTMLDDHVTTMIFSFLDAKSIYEASKVSRSFRDALIPRQKKVTMAGFRSFESFRQLNFLGMEFFHAHYRDTVTDHVLATLASDIASYPNLSRANLGLCKKVTPQGEQLFVKVMGPRLESCVLYERFECL